MPIEPFRTLTSRIVALPECNLDTDQIIPARYLTTTTRIGLGQALFSDRRRNTLNRPRPDEFLNALDPSAHRILVAGDNFGCGSSREHAVWALLDFGFRAVISTSFGDIFRSNALKNGLLAIVLDQDNAHQELLEKAGCLVTIDLRRLEIRGGEKAIAFEIDTFSRSCLLNGVDMLAYLKQHTVEIESFANSRRRHIRSFPLFGEDACAKAG